MPWHHANHHNHDAGAVAVLIVAALPMGLAAEVVEVVPADSQTAVGENTTRINRTLSAWYPGSGWAVVYGDNNFFTEIVQVANASNKTIVVKAYRSSGVLVGTRTLSAAGAGAQTTFTFEFDYGTYYFEVQFVDGSSGWINLVCLTV